MITPTRILVLLLATLVLGGCGGSGGAGGGEGGSDRSTSKARSLFKETCGSCHVLEDAGTEGTIGPPLDGIGMDAESVRAQIERGGGAMPPELLKGKDADIVAEYVASQAG